MHGSQDNSQSFPPVFPQLFTTKTMPSRSSRDRSRSSGGGAWPISWKLVPGVQLCPENGPRFTQKTIGFCGMPRFGVAILMGIFVHLTSYDLAMVAVYVHDSPVIPVAFLRMCAPNDGKFLYDIVLHHHFWNKPYKSWSYITSYSIPFQILPISLHFPSCHPTWPHGVLDNSPLMIFPWQ